MCCCITWLVVCKCSCNHLQSRLWLYPPRWILLRPTTDCSRSGPSTAGRNPPHQTPAAQIGITPTMKGSTTSQPHNHTHSPSSTSNTPPAARAVWTCRTRCSGSPDSRWASTLPQTQGPDPAGDTHTFILQQDTLCDTHSVRRNGVSVQNMCLLTCAVEFNCSPASCWRQRWWSTP